MFGLGMGELLVILVVALLFIGPDKLPETARKIGKGIRDLKKQTRELQDSLEQDTQIGEAMKDLKSALRGEDSAPRPPGAQYTTPRTTARKPPGGSNESGDKSGDKSGDGPDPASPEGVEAVAAALNSDPPVADPPPGPPARTTPTEAERQPAAAAPESTQSPPQAATTEPAAASASDPDRTPPANHG